MVKTEKMVKVLFTQEEYEALLEEFSETELHEILEMRSIDRKTVDDWDYHRVSYNTLVALRRAEPIEIELDLYDHE